MAKNCFVEMESADYVRLTNTSGADVVPGELVILGGVCAIAQSAIASNAVGNFLVDEGAIIQIAAADLKTSEDTFGTANADVYYDNSAKKFSDTKTIGYYKIGQVSEVKTNGVVRVLKDYKATIVPTLAALADVNVTGVDDNDTMKYVQSTGKWTRVAV